MNRTWRTAAAILCLTPFAAIALAAAMDESIATNAVRADGRAQMAAAQYRLAADLGR